MWKTVVVLPDGTEISSGKTRDCVIQSFSLTERVNEEQELTVGSVCASMVELTLLNAEGCPLKWGTEFTVYRENQENQRRKIGVFVGEKPVWASPNTMKLTAYDRVSCLDKDLTGWLNSLTGWPYKLGQFGQMVCESCGVSLRAAQIPNGEYLVRKFSSGDITGRQLMRWIGELAGCFCRSTPDGELELGWYTPTSRVFTPTGEGYYFQNGFACQDYQVEKLHYVQIRQSAEDVGTVFPETPEGDNGYVITGNPLASAVSAGSLSGVAQTILEQLQDRTYTPCSLKIPADSGVRCGEIVTVRDTGGTEHCVYVMGRRQSGGREELECTGSIRRDSTGARNRISYKTISGKILNLQTTVDGLRAENRDNAGKMASISMDVEGISTEVMRQQTDVTGIKEQLTTLTQTAQQVDIRVQEITQSGVQKVKTETGFTFDSKGLTISREDSRIENRLNETGMYVRRQGEVILKADQEGVTAVDVSVGNYLIVGDHARFEDYQSSSDGKRTACFWI